jgi:uncharacterized OsmC-like protein
MTQVTQEVVRNGIDTSKLFGTLDVVKQQPELAKFQWRATNKWMGGSHNRSTIKEFYGAGQVDTSRAEAFEVDAGEPGILLGVDDGPNPAEYLLHALAACLTTSLVYVASARGIHLTEVSSTLEGDMDLMGAMGLDKEVRNGFEEIRVTFTVKGDAPPEELEKIVERAHQRSAVFDSITRGVPVKVSAIV